ncbi:Electron transfer flavoprotein subunit alpha protein [Thalictrum thalictroides]|uniref:Electron transfer flavoprotein subunit alpha n=1 Tax=Thalictrum thalictroides TaxID=46969 RepID=A0A7J6UXR2_THATH|nr:Electron transfer flavoprotein subunit alpha protein [Thalictrum thalictroides]
MASLMILKSLKNQRSFSSSFLITSSISRFVSTLILGEHEGGQLKQSSLCAVTAARAISDDNSITMLLAGSGPSLQQAASHAASIHPSMSQVFVADSDKLSHPLAEPWAELVHLVQQKGGYSHIIAASSSFGKNILPRAAALLDVSPITDVIEISGPQLFVRPIYAGNALSTVRYTGVDPCLLTIRSTSFPLPHISSDSKSEAAPVSQVDLSTFSEDILDKSRFLKLTSQDTERPDLGSARVVVTGGRGLRSAENFKLMEKLAEKLSAAVGATRAAVDAGFVPNELQVGQTGKIVAPELYMAFGVSGAIQHLAGMRDSKTLVYTLKEGVADYGLVADLMLVVYCFCSLNKLSQKLALKI